MSKMSKYLKLCFYKLVDTNLSDIFSCYNCGRYPKHFKEKKLLSQIVGGLILIPLVLRLLLIK